MALTYMKTKHIQPCEVDSASPYYRKGRQIEGPKECCWPTGSYARAITDYILGAWVSHMRSALKVIQFTIEEEILSPNGVDFYEL